MKHVEVSGKLDTKIELEKEVDARIRAAFEAKAAGYLCTYGDDPAGDLAIKIERGDAMQTVVIEAHAWPQAITQRILEELQI